MRRKNLRRLVIAACLVAVLAALNLAPLLSPPATVDYQLADIPERDVYAPISFPIPKDSARLAAERDSAAAEVLPVLRMDKETEQEIKLELRSLRFPDSIPEDFPATTRELLLSPGRERLIAAADTVIENILSQGYTLDKGDLGAQRVKILMNGAEVEESLANLLGPSDVDTLIFNAARRFFGSQPRKAAALYDVVFRLLAPRPNLRYAQAETEKAKQVARSRVNPYKGFVERGDLLLESEQPVDEAASEKIAALNTALAKDWKLRLRLSLRQNLVFILVVLMFVLAVYLVGKRPRVRDLLYLTILVVVGMAASFALRRFSGWWFIPTGFVALSVALFLSPLEGILAGGFLSILLYLPWQNEPEYLLYALLTAVGALAAQPLMRRKTGFLAAFGFMLAGGIIARLSFVLSRTNVSMVEMADMGMAAGINAVLNLGFLLAAFIAAEKVFGYASDLTLARLADLNHPLLRKFALKAAGSYHHSVIIGNLAEKAAKAIGADADLALAGGYFHDIGKMEKPEYFIENQSDNQNPHQGLKPRMSALILANHVKRGLVVAERHGLPKPIKDIIAQHQGTTRMEFFYQKYLQTRGEGEETVPEEDFRYPGPKPQIKESALVMLADSVEAAVRAKGFSDREELSRLIKEVIDGKVADGQLDECAFTTRDIHVVREVFTSTLPGIFHPRITYEAKHNSGSTTKSTSKRRSSKSGKKRS